MNLLLDTHIWIWGLLEPEHLRPKVVRVLKNPANDLWLSPISIWEFLILVEKGRIILESDPNLWLEKVLKQLPFKEAPLNFQVAKEARFMKLPHNDPADCFLAATARVYNLTLVTADQHLLKSSRISTLANK
ncbi:MAG TPA: type II toxin-antitoxin system VapC family toxin [Thermodesulfobacteriota bacterium]|nr:type II toxin-antitoxin system VapC family toxin [Thermodesulfobacteriota bacterium]